MGSENGLRLKQTDTEETEKGIERTKKCFIQFSQQQKYTRNKICTEQTSFNHFNFPSLFCIFTSDSDPALRHRVHCEIRMREII